MGKTMPCKHETSYGVQYKNSASLVLIQNTITMGPLQRNRMSGCESTTCIHSRFKMDPEPHSDLVERGQGEKAIRCFEGDQKRCLP